MVDLILNPAVIGAIVAVFGLFGAFLFGKKTEKNKQIKKKYQAMKDKKEIDDEIDNLSHVDLGEQFNKWVRK